jgi:hypothetical protein
MADLDGAQQPGKQRHGREGTGFHSMGDAHGVADAAKTPPQGTRVGNCRPQAVTRGIDTREHVGGHRGKHEPSHQRGRQRGALGAHGGETPVAEDHQPVEKEIEHVGGDHHHHPRHRPVDAFEEKHAGGVKKYARQSPSENHQYAARARGQAGFLAGPQKEGLADVAKRG